jgi:hypothetical protein
MKLKITAFGAIAVLLAKAAQAQTDHDAIMMNKHQPCNGIFYERSQKPALKE